MLIFTLLHGNNSFSILKLQFSYFVIYLRDALVPFMSFVYKQARVSNTVNLDTVLELLQCLYPEYSAAWVLLLSGSELS